MVEASGTESKLLALSDIKEIKSNGHYECLVTFERSLRNDGGRSQICTRTLGNEVTNGTRQAQEKWLNLICCFSNKIASVGLTSRKQGERGTGTRDRE